MTAQRVITVTGRRWFQRTYGNTYHSVTVHVDGEQLAYSGIQYGYGDQYLQTAAQILLDAGVLKPPKDALRQDAYSLMPLRIRAEEQGFKLVSSVHDVARERDL